MHRSSEAYWPLDTSKVPLTISPSMLPRRRVTGIGRLVPENDYMLEEILKRPPVYMLNHETVLRVRLKKHTNAQAEGYEHGAETGWRTRTPWVKQHYIPAKDRTLAEQTVVMIQAVIRPVSGLIYLTSVFFIFRMY